MELLSHPIRVVHYGLGATGSAIARLTIAQRELQVVGGIERDPAKVDRDLGDVIGLGHPIGSPVSDDSRAILVRTHPDIVIHATASFFHTVYPQILECVQAHANVISTCEELVYPYTRNAAAATQMHSVRCAAV